MTLRRERARGAGLQVVARNASAGAMTLRLRQQTEEDSRLSGSQRQRRGHDAATTRSMPLGCRRSTPRNASAGAMTLRLLRRGHGRHGDGSRNASAGAMTLRRAPPLPSRGSPRGSQRQRRGHDAATRTPRSTLSSGERARNASAGAMTLRQNRCRGDSPPTKDASAGAMTLRRGSFPESPMRPRRTRPL